MFNLYAELPRDVKKMFKVDESFIKLCFLYIIFQTVGLYPFSGMPPFQKLKKVNYSFLSYQQW